MFWCSESVFLRYIYPVRSNNFGQLLWFYQKICQFAPYIFRYVKQPWSKWGLAYTSKYLIPSILSSINSQFLWTFRLYFQRTIKLARCQAADVMLSRSQTSTHLTEAVDTVQKWRVTLLAITDERTQQCPKMSGPLKHSINSVYDAILRLFNKQDWIIL